MKKFIVLYLIFFSLAGCEIDEDITTGDNNEIIKRDGTVSFVNINGGFNQIVVNENEKYFPINLSLENLYSGETISFVARVRNDLEYTEESGKKIVLLDYSIE